MWIDLSVRGPLESGYPICWNLSLGIWPVRPFCIETFPKMIMYFIYIYFIYIYSGPKQENMYNFSLLQDWTVDIESGPMRLSWNFHNFFLLHMLYLEEYFWKIQEYCRVINSKYKMLHTLSYGV